ncbi:MAG: hypothetical protein VX737_02515 [Pseudomonadota bacterium]|nr:hypothetical protein [Pseudomonadota bacterium]
MPVFQPPYSPEKRLTNFTDSFTEIRDLSGKLNDGQTDDKLTQKISEKLDAFRLNMEEMKKILSYDVQVRSVLIQYGRAFLDRLNQVNVSLIQNFEEKKAALFQACGGSIDPKISTVDTIRAARKLFQSLNDPSSFTYQINNLILNRENIDLFMALHIDSALAADLSPYAGPDGNPFRNMPSPHKLVMTLPYHLLMAVSGGSEEVREKYAFLLDNVRQETGDYDKDQRTSELSEEEIKQKEDFFTDFKRYIESKDVHKKVAAYLSNPDLDFLDPLRASLQAQGSLGRTMQRIADKLIIPSFRLVASAFSSGTLGLPEGFQQNLLGVLKRILSKNSTLSMSFVDTQTPAPTEKTIELDPLMLLLPILRIANDEYLKIVETVIENGDQKQLAETMSFLYKSLGLMPKICELNPIDWNDAYLKNFNDTNLCDKRHGTDLSTLIESFSTEYEFSHGLHEQATSLLNALSDLDSSQKDEPDYYTKLRTFLSSEKNRQDVGDLEGCRFNLSMGGLPGKLHLLRTLDFVKKSPVATDGQPAPDIKRLKALFKSLDDKISSKSDLKIKLFEHILLPMIDRLILALEERAAKQNTGASISSHEDGAGSLEGTQDGDSVAGLLSSTGTALFGGEESNITQNFVEPQDEGEPEVTEELRTPSPTNSR